MTTKHYMEGELQVSESIDNNMVAVLVADTVAGNTDASFFIYEPFLRGEDYPALVRIWDNTEDDIYDTL